MYLFVNDYENRQPILVPVQRQTHGICRALLDDLDRLDETFHAIYILADCHNVMMASGDAAEDQVSSAGNIGDPEAMLEQSGSYAMKLPSVAHEVFKQLHHASVNTKSTLIQSIRDRLELFLLMILARYAETIHTSKRMGAVFYNYCLGKLNPSLTHMGHSHKARLPYGTNESEVGNALACF
jgi:hypothetical protein